MNSNWCYYCRFNLTFISILFVLLITSCQFSNNYKNQNKSNERSITKNQILTEMDNVLKANILAKWYPKCIDSEMGGFYSDFDYEWKLTEPQNKMIVTQSRHIWTTSEVSKYLPNNDFYLTVCKHGFEFFRDFMWDKKHGGFYELVDRKGNVIENSRHPHKTAYGNAFAIYGLANYYEANNNKEVLDLAKKTFFWLEKSSYDPINGGYFQFITSDGVVNRNGLIRTPPKDQNSSIHLLEAFTQLYKVWPDKLLEKRIKEMIHILRDKVINQKGYMNLFFREDWSPVYFDDDEFKVNQNEYLFDHISFGHDVEVAYLLLEASEIVKDENDSLTHSICKKVVDHAILNGFDDVTGAMANAGYYIDNDDTVTIIDDTTPWWVAAETMNALLLMSTIYPDDSSNYYDKFTVAWDFCKKYLIDYENGGWYRTALNKEEASATSNKGGIWKGNYHNIRALINSVEHLQSN